MTLAMSTTAERSDELDALERVYVAHGAQLRQALARLAPELDAGDLLHELFLIAIKKADDFSEASDRLAWLYGVAVKLAASRRRTARLRKLLGFRIEPPASIVDAPSRSMEQRDAQHQVMRALEPLSDAKRTVFVLFELQGLSGEEIAAALHIPLKTVWTRLFHARREVAAAIDRQLLTEARTSGLDTEELKR
jgi:RNA polymerase sigma-70 factor (ECF subfamily)